MNVAEHGGRLVVMPELVALAESYAWWCQPCSASWPGHHVLVHPRGRIPLPERHRIPVRCLRCERRCEPEIGWDADWHDVHKRWLPPLYPPLPVTPMGWVDVDRLEAWQRAREVARATLLEQADEHAIGAFDAAVYRDDRRLVADLSLRFANEAIGSQPAPPPLQDG